MGCGVSCGVRGARCYRAPVKRGEHPQLSSVRSLDLPSVAPRVRVAARSSHSSAEDVQADAGHSLPRVADLVSSEQQEAPAEESPRTVTATTSCGASSAHTISDDGSHGSAADFREEADSVALERADAAMELARRGDGVPEVTLEDWTTSTTSREARSTMNSLSPTVGSLTDEDPVSVAGAASYCSRVVRRTVTRPLPRSSCSEGVAANAYRQNHRKLHPAAAMDTSTDGEALSDGDLQADSPPGDEILAKSLKTSRDNSQTECAQGMLRNAESASSSSKAAMPALEAEPTQQSELASEANFVPRRPCVPPKCLRSEEGGLPWCQSPRKRRPQTAVHRQLVPSGPRDTPAVGQPQTAVHRQPMPSGPEISSDSGDDVTDVDSASSAAVSPVQNSAPANPPAPPPPSPDAPPPPLTPPPRRHPAQEETPQAAAKGGRLPRLASIPAQTLGGPESTGQSTISIGPGGLTGIPPLPVSRTCCAQEPDAPAGKPVARARPSSAISFPSFVEMPLKDKPDEEQLACPNGRSLLQRLDPGLPSEEMQRAVAQILAQRSQHPEHAQQAPASAFPGAHAVPPTSALRPLPSWQELNGDCDESAQKKDSWLGYVESRTAVPLSALPPLSPAGTAFEPKAEDVKAEMTRKAAAALANSKAVEGFSHASSRQLAQNGMVLAQTGTDSSLPFPWPPGVTVHGIPQGVAAPTASPLPMLPGMPSGTPHMLPWMPSPMTTLPGVSPMHGMPGLPAPNLLNPVQQGYLALPMMYSPDERANQKDVDKFQEEAFHSPDAAAGRSPDADTDEASRWAHSGRWKDILLDLRGTHGMAPFLS